MADASAHPPPITLLIQLHGQESLVVIMAYDFQNSQFTLRLPRSGQENISTSVAQVAVALWRHKVKLGATLARMRVKANARTVTELIFDTERRRYQRILTQPIYARVNLQKVCNVQLEVLSVLSSVGFMHVSGKEELCLYTKAMQQSKRDLIAFSPDCWECLSEHWLVSEGYLVLQVRWVPCTSGTLVKQCAVCSDCLEWFGQFCTTQQF